MHRLPSHVPSKFTDAALGPSRDCFGRERHGSERDDRGGVGTFSKSPVSQRTLYIGKIGNGERAEQKVKEAFALLGKIERF